MTPVATRQILSGPAENVLAGWLGLDIPAPPKQRNKTRAGYRKGLHPGRTLRRRGDSLIEVSEPRQRQLHLTS